MTDHEAVDVLARARNGDQTAFADLVAPHDRALFRHCYRMLGSGADAEDAVQDTLEKAWKSLDSFKGSGAFGGWLYRIATNVSIDRLRARKNRANPIHEGSPNVLGEPLRAPDPTVEWTEPVADTALGLAPDPAVEVIRREEISLAFVAALQLLAPKPRAVMLLGDVLGFSHADIAATLDISTSTVNSLLHRARQRMRALATDARNVVPPDDPEFQVLLAKYVRAWELADIDQLVGLLAADVSFSMPPLSEWFQGVDTVTKFIERFVFSPVRPGGIPLIGAWVNWQPAFVVYNPGDNEHAEPTGLQVLDVVATDAGPKIRHITSYRGGEIVTAAGLAG